MKIDASKIGNALVKASEKETSAPGIAEQLFPYIYAASARMSTRAVSRWLLENHQLSVSYSTIGRALRESDMHIKRIVEEASVHAVILAREGKCQDESILFDESFFQSIGGHITSLTPTAQQAFDWLESNWWDYPEEFRDACSQFFLHQSGEVNDE